MSLNLQPCTEPNNHTHEQVNTQFGFTVDTYLHSFLKVLWQLDVKTVCSCQGDAQVKHGFFGQKHDHYGFIITDNLEDSITIFSELDRRDCFPVLVVEPDGHHEHNKEYVIEFKPLESPLV